MQISYLTTKYQEEQQYNCLTHHGYRMLPVEVTLVKFYNLKNYPKNVNYR